MTKNKTKKYHKSKSSTYHKSKSRTYHKYLKMKGGAALEAINEESFEHQREVRLDLAKRRYYNDIDFHFQLFKAYFNLNHEDALNKYELIQNHLNELTRYADIELPDLTTLPIFNYIRSQGLDFENEFIRQRDIYLILIEQVPTYRDEQERINGADSYIRRLLNHLENPQIRDFVQETLNTLSTLSRFRNPNAIMHYFGV